jgi:glycosyltransferase involved in cell wall biosynthesis
MNVDRPLKVALMVTVIAPVKMPLFCGLAEHFDLLILHGGMEGNRDSWIDAKQEISGATIKRVMDWQIRAKKMDGGIRDDRHLHVTPGLLWHLFRFRPDVVVTSEMGLRTVLALFYGTLSQKPVWVWWGGTPHTEHRIGTARRILRFVISHWAHYWFSYGETSSEYLVSIGIRRDRIVQIQNGVDETRFSTGAAPEFQVQPRPVLLHAGQLIARKGIDLFLRAASTLQREGYEFSLLFVGSGPDKGALEYLARDFQLKNVNFHSSRPSDKMPGVYRSADVLILPTLSDVWGVVANEAVLSGIPVLCSKYAGCAKELFTEESVFDPQNADEFVAKLRNAVAGRLPKPNRSRIKNISENVNQMISAIEGSATGRTCCVAGGVCRKGGKNED